MKNILNKRLEMVSAFINDNEKVMDIGCDHGLLGIYLVLNRKNVQVISSDINEKPLLIAKENVSKYHLNDKIIVKQGDGLEPITKDVTTVVISGMGGINIANILKNIKNYSFIKKIILSPNSDFKFLRKQIHQVGYTISEEKIVCEKGKYYLIIIAIKGHKKVSSFFGKLNLQEKIVKQYYNNVYLKNKEILNKLSFKNKLKRINLIYENILIKIRVVNK